MSKYISPFAVNFPQMPDILGVNLYTCCSGMRYKKDDILFVDFPEGANVGGLFTLNSIVGAPVTWCRKVLQKGKARGLVVNSGYSNVMMGKIGEKTIESTVSQVKKMLNCEEHEIYIASTGIIGQPVKDDLLVSALESKLVKSGFEQACVAINTTDTFNKGVFLESEIAGKKVKIAGIIKGSGMIAPNMATMLGFIFTDAAISSNVLQQLLTEIKDKTYNAITVDSDTSTSDTILAFATGKAENAEITDINHKDFADFREKFLQANLELAKLVVKDGEWVSKFVTIEVLGAKNNESAKNIALSIANSPLVKTAMAGCDPNWGRIAGAVGKSGEDVAIDNLQINLGENQVANKGALSENYNEKQCQEYMKNPEIFISVDVGIANGYSRVYTIDLTHEYISINADYRS
jgi:glutamate N-acetyltransferase/amino-acid N-acetyltransferase